MQAKGKRIVGLKAIAVYFNTSERTIYRWEKKYNLPLYRVAGAKGTTVFIYVSEAEDWLKTKDSSKYGFHILQKKTWPLIAVTGPLLIISISIFLFITKGGKSHIFNKIPNPITSTISGNIASIRDAKGKELWTIIVNDYPIDIMLWSQRKYLDFLDIDKDKVNEVIAPVYDPVTDKHSIKLFDADGSILWENFVSNDLNFGGVRLESNFSAGLSRFAKLNNGDIRVVTKWTHKARFLSLITSCNCEGELLNKYAHTGHICCLNVRDLDNDGNDEILFSGTNNLLKGEGVLGVLNLLHFQGVCPPYRIEPEYMHLDSDLEKYLPDDPIKGDHVIYLRFKKISQFQPHQRTYAFAYIHDIEDEIIHIQLFPWEFKAQGQYCGFEYVFTNKFELIYAMPDSLMQKYYPQMVKDSIGKIPLLEATGLVSKNVMYWKENGWIPVVKTNMNSVSQK